MWGDLGCWINVSGYTLDVYEPDWSFKFPCAIIFFTGLGCTSDCFPLPNALVLHRNGLSSSLAYDVCICWLRQFKLQAALTVSFDTIHWDSSRVFPSATIIFSLQNYKQLLTVLRVSCRISLIYGSFAFRAATTGEFFLQIAWLWAAAGRPCNWVHARLCRRIGIDWIESSLLTNLYLL